jgi:hypothetical protein
MKEEILKYENRDNLFRFLINDFGFVKQEEKYSPESFGNFYIELSSDKFLLRYINDRSFLTIEIASLLEPSNWYGLSFVENFIYHPEDINPDKQEIGNVKRIEGLNMFLKKDFGLISNLFSSEKYKNTREKIDELLKIRFDQRYPGKRIQ